MPPRRGYVTNKKIDPKSLLRLLKYVFSRYKVQLACVGICLIVSSLASVIAATFMQRLIDEVILPGISSGMPAVADKLMTIIVTMGTIYALGLVANTIYNQIMAFVGQGTIKALRDDMFDNMETLPIRYFDSHAHGEIMSTYTNDVDTLRMLVGQSIPSLFQSVLSLIVVMITMVNYSIWLTLMVLLVIFTMTRITGKFGGRSARYMMEQQQSLAKEEGFIEEMMEGMKVVKVFTHEEEAKKDFDALNEKLYNDARKANENANALFPILANVGNISYVVLAIVGGLLVTAKVPNLTIHGFNTVTIGVIVSIILTILAIIGIAEKDRPEYYGIGGKEAKKVEVSEYIEIIKNNDPMKRLMVAGAGCKLALSIATNTTVLCMLYGCMMGNYDGLYLPMMVLGYICSVPFFLLTVRTSQKKGQKASLLRYVGLAFICYLGVLALLILWKQGNPAWNLTIFANGKFSINLYTVLFVIFFGIGYGAYYATADMPIPMVADCSDYETYRSGKYIPGIMGTLFSLVDKLVSSLSATIVGLAVSAIGLANLPTAETPYAPGMNVVVIILFCVIPLMMKGYILTGEKMKEIQKVNGLRREAVNAGMSLEEAMKKYV